MSDQEERHSLEEHYGFRERKEQRQERRIASKKDRSKYKKTDQKQLEARKVPAIDRTNLKQGRVVEIMSQEMKVIVDGTSFTCVLRGALKKVRTREKNLVAVGDLVWMEETSAGEGVIAEVEERTSVLARADNLGRRMQQIIASNVDQVLITLSVREPPLKPFLVDRYIIASRKGNMDPVIVVNKADLLQEDPEEAELLEMMVESYEHAGIPIIEVSAATGLGLEELRAIMKDKVSVFSGQSGVGKSSLINAITGLELRTRETVRKTRKGSHTTTAACLLPLDFGGWCVDTPGIKSFGVWKLEPEEIEGYFTEIHECGKACHFRPCSHTHEPNCAVLAAVENDEISALRYESYVQLIEKIAEEHKRR